MVYQLGVISHSIVLSLEEIGFLGVRGFCTLQFGLEWIPVCVIVVEWGSGF